MKYRPATIDDAKRLLDWRNDDLTCAMSRSPDSVAWDQHVSWLNVRLARETPHLYIAECKGRPVGSFRIDADEISYTVAPECRGKGYATAMLKLAHAAFGTKKAGIYRRNEPSIRAAERAGHQVVLLD
jgi:RimJ/RimL family protein N-acetyltransferase